MDLQDIRKLQRGLGGFFLGFDQIFDDMDRVAKHKITYPPYNVIQEDGKYFIEMTVAGFAKENISVKETKEDAQRLLTVSGQMPTCQENDGPKYIYRGLASRDFSLTFRLKDNLEVTQVKLENGLLMITLKENKDITEAKVYSIE